MRKTLTEMEVDLVRRTMVAFVDVDRERGSRCRR